MSIKFIYTIFIGILFATFVGVGIAAFYPEPAYPENDVGMRFSAPLESDDPKYQEYLEKEEAFQEELKQYQEKHNRYNRNVSSISIAIAVIALVISLTFLKKINLIADGLLLGGLLLLIYSIIRGFSSDDNMFRFIVVTIGFAVSLALGYIKFIRPEEIKKK